MSDSEAANEQHNEDDYVMDEEYEDEEDRLIAQGGMGIPVDEVRAWGGSFDILTRYLISTGTSYPFYHPWKKPILDGNVWY